MTDPRITRLADLLINYSCAVKPGENILFEAIDVPHATVERADAAADTVRLVGKTAFGTRRVGACLLPRRVTTAS